MRTVQDYIMAEKRKPIPENIKKKQTNVDIILPEIYERLQTEAKDKGISLRRYANDIFEMHYEKEDFVSKYLPQLKKLAFRDGKLYVEDGKIGQIATVGLKKGALQCDVCESTECVHIIYAMTTLELPRIEPKK